MTSDKRVMDFQTWAQCAPCGLCQECSLWVDDNPVAENCKLWAGLERVPKRRQARCYACNSIMARMKTDTKNVALCVNRDCPQCLAELPVIDNVKITGSLYLSDPPEKMGAEITVNDRSVCLFSADFYEHLEQLGIDPCAVPEKVANDWARDKQREAFKGCDAKIEIQDDPDTYKDKNKKGDK